MGQRRLFYDAQLLRCILTACRSSRIRYQHCVVLTYLASDWSLDLKLRRIFQNKRESWIPFSFSWDMLDLKICLAAQLPVTAGFLARWVSCVTDRKLEFLLKNELRLAEGPQFNVLFCIYSIAIWCNTPQFYTFWCLKLHNSYYILFTTSPSISCLSGLLIRWFQFGSVELKLICLPVFDFTECLP